MDGIDVALLKTDGEAALEFGPTHSVSYSGEVRQKLEAALVDARQIQRRTDRMGCLASVETMVTDLHAAAVKEFLDLNRLNASDIDCIGFHGQTVWHRPQEGVTVQLGDGPSLASQLGIDVVFDMRANDMTNGGQGAPLVPIFHQAIARQLGLKLPAVLVNIGGITNVSFVSQTGELLAFDTGPGNMLIDQWVKATADLPFDHGGKLASQGELLPSLLAQYEGHPFFKEAIPKSLDRQDFAKPEPEKFSGQSQNLAADGALTLGVVTALGLKHAMSQLPQSPATMVYCGGGVHNPALLASIRQEFAAEPNLRDVEHHIVTEFGLDGDMIEAQAFAYLAVRSLNKRPLTYPGTTGCSVPTTGGVLAEAPC